MEKKEMIEAISAFTRKHMCRNRKALGYGRCYDVFGTIQHNCKEYDIISSSFSELPDERGKLFFDCMGHGCDDASFLAEELSEEELGGVYLGSRNINKNNNEN